jgi:hypothetical protein
MSTMNTRRVLAAVLLSFTVASCADITAPAPAPQAPAAAPVLTPTVGTPDQASESLLGGLLGVVKSVLGIIGQPVDNTVYVLRRKTPLASPIIVTKNIGYDGGTITVPNTGLTMTIPRGALYRTTSITIAAMPGDKVAYEFGPHGLTFYKPVLVKQSLEGTYAPNSNVKYEAVYFSGGSESDGLLSNLLKGVLGVVLELLDVILDPYQNAVKFEVRHFSGYLVSTGRMTESSDSDLR